MTDQSQKQVLCPVCFVKLPEESENGLVRCELCRRLCHEDCTASDYSYFNRICNICQEKESQKRIFNKQFQVINDNNDKVEKKIDTLRTQLESVERRSRPLLPVSWVYIGLFLFVVGITVFLIVLGLAGKPEVSIQYNVGEIIGGVLAGVGIAVAGAAYAFRSLRRE